MKAPGVFNFGISSFGLFAIVYGIFVFCIQAVMALAVNGDAKRQVSNRDGLFMFGPFLWGWIVFIFGLAGFAIYWAIHHSSLRSPLPPHARPLTPGPAELKPSTVRSPERGIDSW